MLSIDLGLFERSTNISHPRMILEIDNIDGNFCPTYNFILCYVIGVSPLADVSQEMASKTVVEVDRSFPYALVLGVVALVLLVSWCNSFHILCVQYVFVCNKNVGSKELKTSIPQSIV